MVRDGTLFHGLACWIDERRVIVISTLNALILVGTITLVCVAVDPPRPAPAFAQEAPAKATPSGEVPAIDPRERAAPSRARSREGDSTPGANRLGAPRRQRVLIRRPEPR